MGNLDRCQWKMVDSSEFTMGVLADRCGDIAVLKILRPFRKTDLFLCECHFNAFIDTWGLHNQVEILPCEEEPPCDCGRTVHYTCPRHDRSVWYDE